MNLHSSLALILQNDQRYIVYYLVLLEVAAHLREVMQDFELKHLVFVADELNVDLYDLKVRPHSLEPTSEAIGLVAAAVWGEPPAERWKWKLRLNDPSLGSPSEEERERMIGHIRRMSFIVKAEWEPA